MTFTLGGLFDLHSISMIINKTAIYSFDNFDDETDKLST